MASQSTLSQRLCAWLDLYWTIKKTNSINSAWSLEQVLLIHSLSDIFPSVAFLLKMISNSGWFTTEILKQPKSAKEFAEFQVIILFFPFLLFLKTFKAVQSSPVGRNGTPEDIARLVSYLASKDSLMVTGTFAVCRFYQLLNITINHTSFRI